MKLSQLLKPYFSLPAELERDISSLTLSSRDVQSNSLFFAVKGTQHDGGHYIPEAVAKGAIAVLVDADTHTIHWQHDIPLIPIANLSQKIGPIAAEFYGHPAKQLRMIGVTGTSGKTSCTHFIAQTLQLLGIPCGIMGTLGCGFYGKLGEVGLTTPDAITLQATLKRFVEQGAKAIAMEVSSHSIDQGRINGIDFEVGVFTNLSQDHLDYHGDMATYAAVKHRFLADFPVKNVILNADDAYGQQWVTALATTHTVLAYGTQAKILPVPYICADHIQCTLHGIQATFHLLASQPVLSLPLIGQFNVSNVLATIATLSTLGLTDAAICAQLPHLAAVPGRMQTVGERGKPLVVVDYAHKPDALLKVLQTLRILTTGQLICVFGCGGNRDRGKRPQMAAIAEQFADRIIVTNDNPRHEIPEAIVAEIMPGFSQPERVTVELDRSKAIKNSIQWAKAGDCVLIAGKGAEHYQQIGDVKLPFDDVEQAMEKLRC